MNIEKSYRSTYLAINTGYYTRNKDLMKVGVRKYMSMQMINFYFIPLGLCLRLACITVLIKLRK